MNNLPSKSECRKCNKEIYWHKSSRTGKNYPCDSPDDRRAFHKCDGSPQPKPTPQTITTSYFEPSIEQRVEHIEKQLAALVRTVQEVQSRQPITAEDVGF